MDDSLATHSLIPPNEPSGQWSDVTLLESDLDEEQQLIEDSHNEDEQPPQSGRLTAIVAVVKKC